MTCIETNLNRVLQRMAVAYERTEPSWRARPPWLVAASKLKPASAVLQAYQAGQRDFGENYVQELIDKSNSEQLVAQCPDIRWHMIGHLQGNKVNRLVRCTHRLYMVQSVDSMRLAAALSRAVGQRADELCRLKVMIQVNTSAEERKSGVQPDRAVELAEQVAEQCRNLELAGFMTIGSADGGGVDSDQPNPDFLCMNRVRREFCQRAGVAVDQVELSMGMSADFEAAIGLGSSCVRVGSAIFGLREQPLK